MGGETILDTIHRDKTNQATHIGGKVVLDSIHGDKTASDNA